jgi:hypothetical protein
MEVTLNHGVPMRYPFFVAAVLAACAPREVPMTEVAGDCVDAYQARVCTWATMKGDSVLDVGADIPVALIENAPEHTEMAWPPAALVDLKLPDAVRAQSGLTHLTVFWESMGHPPGPFLTPHFDFHFYTMSQADRDAIDCGDLNKPATLAEGYVLPDIALPPPMVELTKTETLVGLCVPKMGMHSLQANLMEGSDPFRGTMVLGYWKSGLIFIEPMISKAMLMEKKAFDLPIPSIPGRAEAYPRTFRADYNAEKNAYRFAFSGFRAGD